MSHNTIRPNPLWLRGVVIASAAAAVCTLAGCGHTPTPSPAPSVAGSATFSYAVPTDTTSRVPAPTAPPQTPVATPSALPPQFAGLDRQDPGAVAAAVVSIWYGWDTTTDVAPYDATVRATPLLTPYLAQSIASFPPVGGPGADWLALTDVSAKATVTAQVTTPEAGTPEDTPDSAVRYIAATQTFQAAKPISPRQLIVVVSLVKGPAGWMAGQVTQR